MQDKLVRVQFEVSREKLEELDDWMRVSQVRTRTDFFNNALSLLIWAMRERMDGRIIASVDNAGKRYKELSMPILENVVTSKIPQAIRQPPVGQC